MTKATSSYLNKPLRSLEQVKGVSGKDSMADLIKQLEAAMVGSRELDAEIYLMTSEHGAKILEALDQPMAHYTRDGWIGCVANQSPALPYYTTSIDAALELVPEGDNWILSKYSDWGEMLQGYTAVIERPVGDSERESIHFEHIAEVMGRTPALALCIAALRARATVEDV